MNFSLIRSLLEEKLTTVKLIQYFLQRTDPIGFYAPPSSQNEHVCVDGICINTC